ncbi:unnamed protein product [Brachionus calyciflorus]|uniref:Integrase catalytic domain-containing protein n=1 Tax=Brachionus calyciflorus TaxID=104777 RepID=A0A814KS06_9BILA|nr:unnamed protein product [Brachionus calyciflorus]
MNIKEPLNSDWASPIVLVKKPDGSERFCVDYRKVNMTTIKDCNPMPNIESKLNKLNGSRIFTSLDCTSSYCQIKLTEKAKQITSKTHSNADPLSRIEHQSQEKEIHKEDLIETLVTSTMIEDKIKYNEDNLLKSINPIVLSTSKSNKDNQLQKFIKGNCPGLTQPNRQIIRNVENITDCTDSELSIDNSIKKLQNTDRDISQLLFKVKNNQIKGFQIENNVLFKLRRQKNGKLFKQLVVPKELKLDILKMCHDNFTGAHLGQRKTWIKLNNLFYWPNSRYKNYVESCDVCSTIKDPPATRAGLKTITEFQKPFDMVAGDILELTRTNSGNKYVVVFTDYLTKLVEAFPLRDQTAESIAKIFINEIISRHSAPSKLLSDQGRNFLSNLIKSIFQYFKINKVQTSP